MKLIAAIVQEQDANKLLERVGPGRWAATRINTVGGFLRKGNVTLLLGVEDERVEETVETIRQAVGSDLPPDTAPGAARRGTIFVLDVTRFIRI